MATHRIDITGRFKSDNASVFWEPASVKRTTAPWKYDILIYKDTATRDGAFASFDIPQNYVGGAAIIVHWTTDTATSGDVEFDFDYRAISGDDTESLNQASSVESVNQNDTAPSAVHERMTATLTLTAGNFAAGDTCQCGLFRDGTDVGDGISDEVQVEAILFQYTDA